MPIRSRWQIEVPRISLPTYLFDSPTAPLPTTSALISTANPDNHFLSHAGYRLWSQRLALGLQRAGLAQGERVLLFSGNSVFFPVVILGIVMAGGIFTGANPSYVVRELAYQLKDSGAKFLICSEASLATGIEAAKAVGLSEDNVFAFDDGAATFEGRGKSRGNIRHWTTLLASDDDGRGFAWENQDTDDFLNRTIVLNYSSGTTGVPKGVMITHRNYVSNCVQGIHVFSLDLEYKAKIARSRQLCALPMYHAMGQVLFCFQGPVQRVPIFIMPKFDLIAMLEAAQNFRITDLLIVPPIIVAMAKHPATRKFDLSAVERVISAAAPLGREVCKEFEKLWKNGSVNVKQAWGLTELTLTGCTFHPATISTSNAVGELAPNCEVRIVSDEDGLHEVKHGERGEVWIRAPSVMKGYWRNTEATKETITKDGWLKTGDIGRFDETNHLYIVDRKKELIKVKGLQVAPAEIESLLLEHPAIADVAIIGVTVKGEEAPRAYAVLQQGSMATAKEIQDWAAERVSRFKRLTGGVRFVEAIPKNPSGKILRKVLRDQARAEGGDSEPRESKL
ncbi:4-coumarate-CoA ligase 2 [Mytilinidion resinicola]|uniref:4-coumarate-CoA ligase 2 n=1 Tax=Mytilinidion resinicola TaxID=574789 RepID=A0A6A6Z760_9PEZI|nr:4-coumarate-CoA ligase 2 [Mytilinidion resinicola]KAF2816941.1 4-coumarate-CoA ligase 2 [Mytilinidion resinicola]